LAAPGQNVLLAEKNAPFGQKNKNVPLGQTAKTVRRWFDAVLDASLPSPDGTLATARQTAEALAQHAKSGNTRRAYRAAIRIWCDFCETHGLCPLPAAPADIAAFLSAQRCPPPPGKALSANTLRLRIAALTYLHYVAGCPSPTATAEVGETFAGISKLARQNGDGPKPKLAAKIGILREILAPIGTDLPGLRDKALLLIGFAGAFRRAELAAMDWAHIETCEQGLRITLPLSKGDREGKGVEVGIPYGVSDLCPVRALHRWLGAAGITEGPVFRRIWAVPSRVLPPGSGTLRHAVGSEPLDPGSIGRMIKTRGVAAGFDPAILGGHSLKRGALNTARDRRVHPSQLKQLARHKSYAALAAYIEEGDIFGDHPLKGVL